MDKSYLHNISQYVEIHFHESPKLLIKCGLPQGSILGSLLFRVYIFNSTNGNILSFADDTTQFMSDDEAIQLFSRANICINNLFDWVLCQYIIS